MLRLELFLACCSFVHIAMSSMAECQVHVSLAKTYTLRGTHGPMPQTLRDCDRQLTRSNKRCFLNLGGNFGPEKKKDLAPPQFPSDTLQAPQPTHLLGDLPPLPGIFNQNRPPPPSWRLGLPLPLLRAAKK